MRHGLLAGGGLLAVAAAAISMLVSHEPAFHGKSTGAWVDELGAPSSTAANALLEMGPATIPPLILALSRKPSAWIDAYYSTAIPFAPRFLRSRLYDHYLDWARRQSRIPRLRVEAARVLGDFGTAARMAAPALIESLKDRDPIMRRNAAFALGKIGAPARLATPALAQALCDRNDEVRMYAAIALKRLGPGAEAAIPALRAAMKDPNWQVRERAALAVGTVGRNREGVVEALEAALQDEHRYVRSSAALALATLAPTAPSALATLSHARYDPDAEVRYSASVAIDKLMSGPAPDADGK